MAPTQAYNNVVYLRHEDEPQEAFETSNAIIFIDHNFRLKNLNKEAEKICGIDKTRTIGKKADDVFKHCGENFLKIFKNVYQDDMMSTTIKMKIKDKHTYIHADSMSLRNDTNEFMGIIIILQDLSSLRAAIKQIQVTQMLMSLGELAAGVAHHVRTPLTTISGYLQVMLTRLEDDRCSVSRNLVEMLLSEVSCINGVVKELILFAKPPINKETSKNINRILEEALLLTFSQMGGEKIEIDKKLAENLPVINVDGNLLKQALVNIMQNAIEAMPDEGKLSIRSWLNSDLNMIVISIADTGSGVSSDVLPRIFEPFYTTKLDRMGLGLSVAHRIINEHGGFININSYNHDKPGANVNIYLPIIDEGRSHLRVIQQQILNLQ